MVHAKVILWDVYGTLLKAERGDFASLLRREAELRPAFQRTVEAFHLDVPPAALHARFLQELAAERAALVQRGSSHPEVRIEETWRKLLQQLAVDRPVTLELAREVGIYFERNANPKALQPRALETLQELRRRGLRLGIISNAQFYTLLELSDLLRAERGGEPLGTEAFFEAELVFLSCDLGVAKPDLTAFRRCLEVLAPDGIRAPECVFVGDSPESDIAPALEVGMRAVLYCPRGVPAVAEGAIAIKDLPELLDLI